MPVQVGATAEQLPDPEDPSCADALAAAKVQFVGDNKVDADIIGRAKALRGIARYGKWGAVPTRRYTGSRVMCWV